MPSAPKAPRRRKARRPGVVLQSLRVAVRFVISPIVLFWDSFQSKRLLDRSWLFSFFLLNTLLLGLTGVGILVTDGPLSKTLKMMATLTGNQQAVPGDLQPTIQAINRYALENNIDPNLIYALVKTESDFRETAVSKAGARGLMQIMPEVWRHYSGSACSGSHGLPKCSDNCIFAAEANLRVGTRYFRELLNQYDGRVDLALEAYNAGLTNVIPGFAPKYEETRNYVQKTIVNWKEMRQLALAQQLKLSLRMQSGLKVLFGLSFLCWLALFWWSSRKLFQE